MKVRRTMAVVVLVTAVLTAMLTGSASAQTTTTTAGGATRTYRIGLEAPLSGDQKNLGQGMLHGAQLAAAQLNARGGLLGRQVEIVAIDDAADPATGVTAAQAAIGAGLDGVVGPYNSGVGAQTLPLYLAAGLTPIRLTSADSTAGLGYTLQPMTSQIAPVAADAIESWLGATKVAIVYDSTALYTQTVATALQTAPPAGRGDHHRVPAHRARGEELRRRRHQGGRHQSRRDLRRHLLPGGWADRQGDARRRRSARSASPTTAPTTRRS